MMWVPPKDWQDQDAYLIGGGSSLKQFNFKLLVGQNTIGINDAYLLGTDVVKYCMFGDASWWFKNSAKLAGFQNPIVTCAPSLEAIQSKKVLSLQRKSKGLYDGGTVGWNFCTGASAINLAINLGARRIHLLGFDMRAVNGKTHWHALRTSPTREAVFERFYRGFEFVAQSLCRFPSVEVIHVNDDETLLPFFKHMSTHAMNEQLAAQQMEIA